MFKKKKKKYHRKHTGFNILKIQKRISLTALCYEFKMALDQDIFFWMSSS